MAANDKPKKKSGKLGFFTFVILFCIAAPFMMPTLAIVMLGMVPTFVAFLTDGDPKKAGATAIGWMNCAGVTPFVIDLWMKGQTMENAVHILREPSNWLVILGTAFVGHLIVFAVPQAMASLTLASAEIKLKTLKSNLEQLRASWGPDVATTKPLDKIGKD